MRKDYTPDVAYVDLYQTQYNADLKCIHQTYDHFNAISGLNAHEITFTVDPKNVKDIQRLKRDIMSMVVARIKDHSNCVAYILTRENHANGYPHIHGIVWFPKDNDNVASLTKGGIYNGRNSKFVELGYSKIYNNLRTTPYVQEKTGNSYLSWLDYMLKDQTINWRTKNAVGHLKATDVTWFLNSNDEFID